MYPPTGTPIDLKIERADYHRKLLVAELQAFRDREPQPYLIREHGEEWNGIRYRVLTAYQPERPPDIISLMLGDFLNNLRAALDYLVGEMRPDGPSKHSAFPICARRTSGPGHSGFLDVSKKKLAGIPDPAKERIERMQPYDRRYGRPRLERRHWDVLRVLETLWNIDKHRTVLLSTGLLAPKEVWHNRTDEEDSGIGFRFSPARDEADIWLPIDERDQRFNPRFLVEVALAKPRGFADDWPDREWGEDLGGLVDYMYRTVVWSVLPQLREFIQRGP
jgi:hypothetical protein